MRTSKLTYFILVTAVVWMSCENAGAPTANTTTPPLPRWVMVGGNHTILTTTDPADLTTAWKFSINSGGNVDVLWGVTTDGKGTWVAVGDNGIYPAKIGPAGEWQLITTGATVTAAALGPVSGSLGGLRGVATDGTIWVAVGIAKIATSTTADLTTWTANTPAITDVLRSVATDGKGTWVAVGSNNLRATTTDITSWQVTASPIDFGGTARTLSFNAVAVEQP